MNGNELIKKVFKAVVPPIILIFAVLGSIFFGIATPTEAGAVGAVGASILAAFNKRLTPQLIRDDYLWFRLSRVTAKQPALLQPAN